jgi:Uma2 family endonuclease
VVIAERVLTIEEFLRLPEREPPLEYEDGEVTQKVSPKLRHSRSQMRLALAIAQRVGPTEPVLVFPELRITFGGRSVVPDLAVFRRERVPVAADGELENDVFVPPDLAVEIVSPKQSVTRLIRRCLWYVANGVSIAVLVDPDDRSVLVFRPGGESQALRGGDAIDLGNVVPGFGMTAGDLFAALKVR